jgi:chaperonin GroEL (HSP60 family)
MTAGKDRDVLKHRLTAITEARSLDARDLEAAAQLVDHERRQRLALQDAASIAGLMVTTEATVAEAPKKNAAPAMPGGGGMGGMGGMDY